MGDVEEFSTRVTHADGKVIVEVRGEVDVMTAPVLSGVLDSALAECGGVVIDLRSIEFIDSSGLATLLRALQAAPQRVVVRPNHRARRVLEVAGLLGVFGLDGHDEPGST
jgi:anti-sigma B factor antagonist